MAERTYIAKQAIGLPRKVVRRNGEFTVDSKDGDALVEQGLAELKGKAQGKAKAAQEGDKTQAQGDAQGGSENATSGQGGEE
ncbi:MAG: hypothetical protein ACOC0M_00405 [Halomonas sp.]